MSYETRFPWHRKTMNTSQAFPAIRQTVLDTTDARALAEFYRQLLGLEYRPGDESPPRGLPDPNGRDWLVLRSTKGEAKLALQQVEDLPEATWPEGPRPQQLHLDLTVTKRVLLFRRGGLRLSRPTLAAFLCSVRDP